MGDFTPHRNISYITDKIFYPILTADAHTCINTKKIVHGYRFVQDRLNMLLVRLGFKGHIQL